MLLLFCVIDVFVFLNCTTMQFLLNQLVCLEGTYYLILLFVVAEICAVRSHNVIFYKVFFGLKNMIWEGSTMVNFLS